MNLLTLNATRFDTRVLLARECQLNYHGTTVPVKIRRVGDNPIHPVFEAVDVDTGKKVLEWSSLQMYPAEIGGGVWFTVEVYEPYRTNATLIVPPMEEPEEGFEDDE